MKSECAKYKDLLLEAALDGTSKGTSKETSKGTFDEHLRQCDDCASELQTLRARREMMDALLPMVAGEAEPGGGFRAQVLAAAEAGSEKKRAGQRRVWVLAGTIAVLVLVMAGGLVLKRRMAQTVERASGQATPTNQLVAAQTLAVWRAPSDVLLQTPGQEFLRTTPKLGESYLSSPLQTIEEK
jgi:hypothetical protein